MSKNLTTEFFTAFVTLLFLGLLGAPNKSWAYNVDPNKITVSGISSGSYMAGQLQMSHSSLISGAAFVAGGPYNCAHGNPVSAVNSCMETSALTPTLKDLRERAFESQEDQLIDPLTHMKKHKVLIIHGEKDKTVHPSLAQLNQAFYQDIGAKKVSLVMLDNAAHTFPTSNFGKSCETEASPFIGKCQFDGAGEILSFLYGPLKPPAAAEQSGFIELDQNTFVEKADASTISMDSKAFLYVPKSCQSGSKCGLHIAIHGCHQGHEFIGDQFYKKAGYNRWAESNSIIVLYPQAIVRHTMLNPNGCWDWYGYTDTLGGQRLSHTQLAPQVKAIKSMIDSLIH